MFLSLTTIGPNAPELSWLVHKHPDRHQTFPLPFGTAHVFWPAFAEAEATVALYVEVDPIQLVRGRADSDRDGPLAQYVNDRPYSASSLLSVSLSRVFRSAMGAAHEGHPDVPRTYRAHLPVLPARGGEGVLRRLFEPLGYTVTTTRHPRDPEVPDWGLSHLYDVTLEGTCTLGALLHHLYVLIPVLDNDKHYWVGSDEVDKLLRHGEGWLSDHPEKDIIALRYLKHRRGLARRALEALVPDVPEEEEEDGEVGEAALEKPLTLNQRRLHRVVELLAEQDVTEVVDLGCGEGKLLKELLKHTRFQRVVGVDVSSVALEKAERRLKLHYNPDRFKERLTLWTGSASYRDRRLDKAQAIVLVEVIEHMEEDRLPLLEESIFAASRPAHVVVTTPNREYNILFPDMSPGSFRHTDHRFEWDRATFEAWANRIGSAHGYAVAFEPIGDADPAHGAPTQLAHFRREA